MGIDSKVISVCLINDYRLIADLHKFVYGRAECAYILIKSTKVKLSILNNFDPLSRLIIEIGKGRALHLLPAF